MKKTLIFRIGSLGDNLLALPSVWTVRENFSEGFLFILGSKFLGSNRVMAQEVFGKSDPFKGFYKYPNPMSLGPLGKLMMPVLMGWLLFVLRREGFDTLVYLAPSARTTQQVERDLKFFKLAGIKRFIGMEGFTPLPQKNPGQKLPEIPQEADLLLARLKASGLETPLPGQGKMNLELTAQEEDEFQTILVGLPKDGGRQWVGIAPGSNMPAKKWPLERYAEIGDRLIKSHGVWPVVFGGTEDAQLGQALLEKWGCGYNFAGLLPVRLSAVGLKRCKFYLGNDTGTMHLAAAVNTPCVAIFSARGFPGQWYPYGPGHRVFHNQVDCEGCGLEVCVDRKMECILTIQPDEVLKACEKMLSGVGYAKGTL